MKEFQTKRRVHHSAGDMFDLVADVEAYPSFVPLCDGLKVRSRQVEDGVEILIADMTIAYKILRETFKSRVTLDRPAGKIVVDYLDGPFRTLHNSWNFSAEGDNACDVDFFIAYEFRSLPLQILAGAAFDKVVRKLTEAFEKRADEIYGVSPIIG